MSDVGVRSPAGEYSPLVWWRSARSGAGSAAGAGLRHAAPAVGCLLPAARPRYLLVLAGDELYVSVSARDLLAACHADLTCSVSLPGVA